MSTGGEVEVGIEASEVRRERWRYVKGGFLMVILLCVGGDLTFDPTSCDFDDSIEVASISRTS